MVKKKLSARPGKATSALCAESNEQASFCHHFLRLHYKQKLAAANRSTHLCRRGCKCRKGKQVVRDNGNGYVQGALVLQETNVCCRRKKRKKNSTPGLDTGVLIRPRYGQTLPNTFASSKVVAKCCRLLCYERTDALWLVASALIEMQTGTKPYQNGIII